MITMVFMVASGVMIFTGIFILAATLCFWTIQGLEIANIFTDGGREMAQYPLNIYQKWVTVFFTFVIPFGCVNYLPMLYILDRADGKRCPLYANSPRRLLIPAAMFTRLAARCSSLSFNGFLNSFLISFNLMMEAAQPTQVE